VAHLRLFGPAREAAGVSRVDVAGCTVGQVLTAAESRYGAAFAGVLSTSKIWVNGESATTAVPVTDDDEVAVIPPVSGG
jgi:molybdopterin converting factor small subunit